MPTELKVVPTDQVEATSMFIGIKLLDWTRIPPPTHEPDDYKLFAISIGGHFCIDTLGLTNEIPYVTLWEAIDPFVHQEFESVEQAMTAAMKLHCKAIVDLLLQPDREESKRSMN